MDRGAGDHFWRIAEHTLAMTWGRRPTSAEIDHYWRLLVATNRPHLPDPRNPDLMFVGQVLELPPVPSPPAAEAA